MVGKKLVARKLPHRLGREKKTTTVLKSVLKHPEQSKMDQKSPTKNPQQTAFLAHSFQKLLKHREPERCLCSAPNPTPSTAPLSHKGQTQPSRTTASSTPAPQFQPNEPRPDKPTPTHRANPDPPGKPQPPQLLPVRNKGTQTHFAALQTLPGVCAHL